MSDKKIIRANKLMVMWSGRKEWKFDFLAGDHTIRTEGPCKIERNGRLHYSPPGSGEFLESLHERLFALKNATLEILNEKS